MPMENIECNVGFEGRIFLSRPEWETYKKRMPVRYIEKKKSQACEICGNPPTENNPLQNAHRIGFRMGILYLGLTPDYVDDYKNIVSAHRKQCNGEAELDLYESCKELKARGIRSLPEYLPKFVHDIWDEA